jgi:tRNA (guanine-N7-)-methyltransferase
MFDPDVNPYVAKLEQYRDIIVSAWPDISEQGSKIGRGDRAIVVDLGCGAGNFLRDYALQRPDWDFYGFELRYKRLVKGAQKFKKHGLTNIRLFQSRAEDIASWFLPGSLRQVTINFPDPWLKKKQRKHRLLNSAFLRTLHGLLEPEGCWTMKTDQSEYFLATVALIASSDRFEIVAYTEDLHRSYYREQNIPTEFERLFESKGFPVYYIRSKAR